MTYWSLQTDVHTVVDQVGAGWERLRGGRVFMTGGTGFIGRWMLEVLRVAEERHGLGCQVVATTRDPAAFARRAPHLTAHPHFSFVVGDVLQPLAADGEFSHLIHGATDASADLNLNNPRRMFDTVVDGTRHALALAVEKRVTRALFMSSGAVYGAQPWEVSHVGEDWTGAPDPSEPKNAYAEAKRAAEMLCAIARRQDGLDVVTARIFALLGPLLSLDIHFAAGNFIRDTLAGKPIVVEGSGSAVRSYLYVADLAGWLWTLLLRGPAGGTYNMGSEDAVTIVELAQRVAALLGGAEVRVLGRPDPGWNPGRYVPSTAKIRNDLGVTPTVSLDEAITRTAIWNGWKQ